MEDNEIHDYPACVFNEGVSCNPKNRNCSECGWNPSVSITRLHRICNAMGIDVPGEEKEKE